MELLLSIAALSIIATVGIARFDHVSTLTRSAKLRSDAETINRAVIMFKASGGELGGAVTANQVLAKLKTYMSANASKKQINPLTQSFVDHRLVAIVQSDPENMSNQLRAYWNPADQLFEVKESNEPGGVTAFELKEYATVGIQSESRHMGSLEFGTETGWIWDYEDRSDQLDGPFYAPTHIPTHPSNLPPPVASKAPPSTKTRLLQPPAFSIPGGNYPANIYPLELELSNPNPPGSSYIAYTINSQSMLLYNGRITVDAGSDIRAQAITTDAAQWTDSSLSHQAYFPDLIDLLPPKIVLSAPAFTKNITAIDATILDQNPVGRSTIRFNLKTPHGTFEPVQFWSRYSERLKLSVNDFPDGFDIIAYAQAIHPEIYEHSTDSTASTTATFFGIPLTGNVLFVLDGSTSMLSDFGAAPESKTRFSRVAEEAALAISNLRYNQLFNIAYFSDRVVWTDGTSALHEPTENRKTATIDQLQRVTPFGGTNYQLALALPFQYSPAPDRVVFLSDGLPNQTWDYSSELAALVSAGIEVDTVALDVGPEGVATLQSISTATNGSLAVVRNNGTTSGNIINE